MSAKKVQEEILGGSREPIPFGAKGVSAREFLELLYQNSEAKN
jgi:hypothetical protein